ncbi:MAG: hypothetical protein JXQ73_28645 [Phycisphaerae bacterium]|nr:hypothetical protein [Phycisphaerae bacterium]
MNTPSIRTTMATPRSVSNITKKAAARYDTAKVTLLVSICRELHREEGPKPFRLGYRTAGRCVGVGKNEAGRMLKMLVADGILELVVKGGQGKDSRYLYVAD